MWVIKGKPGWNACCQCLWLHLTLQPLLISRWTRECSVLESCTSWNWLSSENGLGAQKRFNPGGRRWSLHVSRVTGVYPCCFSAQHGRQRDDGKQGSWDSILGSNVGEDDTVGEVLVWQVQGPELRSPAITQLLSGFTALYNHSVKESEMQNPWGKLANLDSPSGELWDRYTW